MSNPEVGIRLRFLNWQIAAHPVEIQTAELARRYDRLASRWQGIIQRMGFQRAYENLFARLHFQNKLHVRDGMSVLDCGIGSGALTAALYRVYPDVHLHWHGCDISPAMLDVARMQRGSEAPDLRLLCADATALSYPLAHFDLAVCGHVLEHLAEPSAGLRELVRTLKPGAPLVLIITRKSGSTLWLRIKWGLNCPNPHHLQQWCNDAGLSDVACYLLGGGFLCSRLSMAVVAWKRF